MNKNEKARKILDEISSSWLVGIKTADPLLLSIWTAIDKIPSQNIDAIGINSRSARPFLMYNPNFILSLQKDALG